jgi:biotin---protein ligase
VSLAAVQAVQAAATARLGPIDSSSSPLDVRIKWPNDIYARGLKLGGVLCHSSYKDRVFHVVMGVGLNLANRSPTTCVDQLLLEEAQARGWKEAPEPVSREVSAWKQAFFLLFPCNFV